MNAVQLKYANNYETLPLVIIEPLGFSFVITITSQINAHIRITIYHTFVKMDSGHQ